MIELSELNFLEVLKNIILKSTIIIIPATILILIGYTFFQILSKKPLDRQIIKVFIRVFLLDLFLVGLNIPLFFYLYIIIAAIIILIIIITTIINIIRNGLSNKGKIRIINKVSLAIIIAFTVLYFIPNVRFPILFKGYIFYTSDGSINNIPLETNYKPNIQWSDTYSITLNNFTLELPYECYHKAQQSDINVTDTIIIDDNNKILVMHLPFNNVFDNDLDDKIKKIMIDRFGGSVLQSRYYFEKICMSVDTNDLYVFQSMEDAILNFTLLSYKETLIPYSNYFEFGSSSGFLLDSSSEYNYLDDELSIVDLYLNNDQYRFMFYGKMFTEKDIMDIIYYNFEVGR